MASRIDTVTTDCADPRRLAAFWAAALGYETEDDADDWVLIKDPQGGQPNLGFQRVPEPKVVKNRVHLDLVQGDGAWRDEVDRLERLGAKRTRYVDEDPDEAHWIMTDPEGNEFCFICRQ